MANVRPLPRVTDLNAPFYRAAAEGRLVLQRCQDCQRWIYYPRYLCPFCLSDRLEWEPASGEGTILSFTHVYRPQHEFFADHIPVALVAVQLKESPVVIADLVGKNRGQAAIGRSVEATFEKLSPDFGLLHFRLAYTESDRAG